MEATRLCPYCLQPLPGAAQSCPHCGKSFAGRNPGGTLPVGTVLAGRYTVGEVRSIDGEGVLYRGVVNLGGFRVGLGAGHGNAARVVVDFLQRVGERTGIARYFSATTVGFEFTGARDRHLDQAGRQRGEDRDRDGRQRIDWPAILVATTEKHGKVGQGRNRTGQSRRNRRGQDVAVFDVGELVRHHTAQLTLAEHLQNAVGCGDRRVLGVASGGEGIGLRFVNDVDARHRQAGSPSQIADDVVQIGG